MIEKNKLIPNHQFGFRQRHSKTEQTYIILQGISEALERKQCCSTAFLDITQAFDKVRHTGLLYKLKLSLPLNYFLILKSYLQNGHFLVKTENEYTDLSPINTQRLCPWAITSFAIHHRPTNLTRNFISNLCR
jgi:hypothetical protein